MEWHDAMQELTPMPAEAAKADLATPAPAVKVKALDWHKSHITPWDEDWHTVPIGYTVRCADENGWKWQGAGAHGYGFDVAAAKHQAQAHHDTTILAALEPATPLEENK